MAKIEWTLGYTLNCGNFESLRVDVSVADEPRQNESVPDATDRIYKFVESQLSAKIKEAREELGNK